MIGSVQTALENASSVGYETLHVRLPLATRPIEVIEHAIDAPPQNVDLALYFAETNENQAETLLSTLTSQHAKPIFSSIIRSKLRVSLNSGDTSQLNQDALEICGDVQLLLLSQLRTVKSRQGIGGITNFVSYVAAITYNACYKYLRLKYPMRSRLKNRLRYLLTHDDKFVFWQTSDREWLCGLAAWQNTDATQAPKNKIEEFKQTRASATVVAEAPSPNRTVLVALLEWAGEPVELDQVVTNIAELYGIKDDLNESDSSDDAMQSLAQLPDRCDLSAETEQRHYLRQLWLEIRQLPLRQRLALLLNLRDAQGRGVMALLTLTGTASMRQIAEVLEMEAECLASLWNELPLADSVIGEYVGASSQQVVNLRKCARERLARRMRKF